MEKNFYPVRLTVKEACEYIPCARATFSRLMKESGFPAIRLGRKILVPRAELDEWLAARIGKRL